jgi:hypothetical protein
MPLFLFIFHFFFYNIHPFIQSQYIHPSPFVEASLHILIACVLSGGNFPVGPSRESNSGLPYSKPTRCQLSHWQGYPSALMRFEEEGDFLSHNCRCLPVCPHPHPPPPFSKSSFSLGWRLGGREVRDGLLF